MPYVNTLDLVTAAKGRGYAVPAINIVDPLTIKAVVEAADSVGSPVILQTSVKTVKSAGAGVLHFAAKEAAENASVGVSLHLDHCPDREVISLAIRQGWSSVLFDASDRDLEQARKETAEVVAEAHAAGVTVESEIENIIGVEDGVGSEHEGAPIDEAPQCALDRRCRWHQGGIVRSPGEKRDPLFGFVGSRLLRAADRGADACPVSPRRACL